MSMLLRSVGAEEGEEEERHASGDSSLPDQEMESSASSMSSALTVSKELELVLRDSGRWSEAACPSRAGMSAGSASRAAEPEVVSSRAMRSYDVHTNKADGPFPVSARYSFVTG